MREPVFQKVIPANISFLENIFPFDMKCQHYHDAYEIYLQVEGERFLSFDNQKYLLKRGSLYIIAPFELHMTSSADDPRFKRFLLNFAPISVSSVLSDKETDDMLKGVPSCVIELNDTEFEKALFLFKHAQSYSGYGSHHADKMKQMAVALLMDFICVCTKNLPSLTLLESSKSASPVYTAVAYVNSNYDKYIDLDFICNYVHMSKSNFCLVFKKMIGETFIDYLNAVRTARAHQLIATTDMKLGEIAQKTGFSSSDYMSRVFKSIHGVAPSQFRCANTQRS